MFPFISLFTGLYSSKKVSFRNPTISEAESIANTILLILASFSWWFSLISVVTTNFSHNYRFDLYHWDSKQKIYFRRVVFEEKVKTFVPVIKIHTFSKIETAVVKYSFGHSNSFFSVTTGLISAIRVSSDNLVLSVKFWIEYLTNLILTSVTCQSTNSKKCNLLVFLLCSNSFFSRTKPHFFHQTLNGIFFHFLLVEWIDDSFTLLLTLECIQ